MDSGNSGSMQSSSGGDDQEYDSRATDSISPLFNNPSLTFASLSNHPQPPPPQPPPPLSHHHNHTHPPSPPTFFDHPHHQQPHNLDLVWSRSGVLGSGSEPNYSNLGNLGGLPSFPPSAAQPQLGLNQGPNHGPSHSVDGNGGRAAPPNSSVSDQNPITNVGGKNSRKRTRASRRAPTTVLTTDTTNFRQMVQEFTGIPAPPFSSGASPYSRRLDLFSSGGRSSHLETLGPLYPFRPSKVNQVQPSPPPFASSSMLNSSMIDAANGGSSSGNNENYHQMMNIQNPILTFQSLLQSSHPLKYNPLVNGPGFASKAQGNSGIGYNELGVNQEHSDLNLSGFSAQLGSNSSDLSRWRGDQEAAAAAAAAAAADQRLGSFDGGPTQNVGYKMNCSGSTSERRNEGTVDSWICPSD